MKSLMISFLILSSISLSAMAGSQNLESRVEALEEQIQELKQGQKNVLTKHVCFISTSVGANFMAKATTKLEAEFLARKECKENKDRFCSTTVARCESYQAIIRE